MENVVYRNDVKITPEQFVDVLRRSTLDQRRPVNEPERIRKMLEHGNILITAWAGELCVGVSRALSDFSFCWNFSSTARSDK